jgi:lipoate-protein ligase A
MQQWRLIPILEAGGAIQMAIDRWLFEQCANHGHPPTLRFYTWSPAAISLGRFQKDWPDHWTNLQWQGQPIDIVQRPTGGRAVLHVNDLTYSIVAPGQSGRRRETYEYLCGFLVQGWQSLGVRLHYGTVGRGYIGQPNCFGSATAADLVTESGAKFIGSAQAWQGTTVLQHGSMQLYPDPTLWETVFASATSIPKTPSLRCSRIAETLVETATQYFNVQLTEFPFSASEWAEIQSQLSPQTNAVLP